MSFKMKKHDLKFVCSFFDVTTGHTLSVFVRKTKYVYKSERIYNAAMLMFEFLSDSVW